MSGHSKHLWAPTKMIELELVSLLQKCLQQNSIFFCVVCFMFADAQASQS
jgi:hypothetical protein